MANISLRASRNKLIPCAVIAALFLILFLHAPIVPVATGCLFAVLALLFPFGNKTPDAKTAARN